MTIIGKIKEKLTGHHKEEAHADAHADNAAASSSSGGGLLSKVFGKKAPKWKPDTQYTAGQKVRFRGKEYEALADHVSTTAITPDLSILNWKVVEKTRKAGDIRTADWIPDKAYNVGDKVKYGGKRYECLIAHTSALGLPPSMSLVNWKEYERKAHVHGATHRTDRGEDESSSSDSDDENTAGGTSSTGASRSTGGM
jgi:chitodextrinase